MYMYLCFDIKFMHIAYYELNLFHGLPCHSLSTLSWYLDQKKGSWFWASEFIKHGIWCWVCCLVSCILCPRFLSMELLAIEQNYPEFSMLNLKIVFCLLLVLSTGLFGSEHYKILLMKKAKLIFYEISSRINLQEN